jgi:hypothetical protein
MLQFDQLQTSHGMNVIVQHCFRAVGVAPATLTCEFQQLVLLFNVSGTLLLCIYVLFFSILCFTDDCFFEKKFQKLWRTFSRAQLQEPLLKPLFVVEFPKKIFSMSAENNSSNPADDPLPGKRVRFRTFVIFFFFIFDNIFHVEYFRLVARLLTNAIRIINRSKCQRFIGSIGNSEIGELYCSCVSDSFVVN